VLNFNNNAASRTFDLFCWTGTGVNSAGNLTVTFSTTIVEGCSIAVYQVTGSTTRTAAVGTGSGSNTVATANYASVPANNVELWATSGGDGNQATAMTWTPAAGWTEDFDGFNTVGASNSRSYAFETATNTTAALASGNFTASGARTPDSGAIRVLFGC